MKRISPKAIKLWRIREYINAGIWLIIGAAVGISSIFMDFIPWWIFLIPAAIVIYIIIVHAWIITKLRYKYFRYQVLEDEIHIHSGIWFKSEVAVPLYRVQNIDTTVGPIMKRMNLKGISLQTSAEKLFIPELETDKADQLRQDVRALINKNMNEHQSEGII